MPFIVKATDQKTGIVAWLAEVDTRGFHTVATRQMAETFLTVEDAEAAISDIQQTFNTADIVFTIECEQSLE
jgi:hypothetical protein